MKAMFNFGGAIYDRMFLYNVLSNLPVLIILILTSTPLIKKMKINKYVIMIFVLAGLVLSSAYIVNSSYNPFLYFRF